MTYSDCVNVNMFFCKLQSRTVPKDTYSPQDTAYEFLLARGTP